MSGRSMLFVDGSSLLIQVAKVAGGSIRAERPTRELLEFGVEAAITLQRRLLPSAENLRRHWFGSYVGDESYYHMLVDTIKRFKCDAHLYRHRGSHERCIDIGLTGSVLVNAFAGNLDTCVLIAGDEGYIELVEETKRLGVRVLGAFPSGGLGADLPRACDAFYVEEGWDTYPWGDYLERLRATVAQGQHLNRRSVGEQRDCT
jgi:NYN domain